jgi:hypothetical protein
MASSYLAGAVVPIRYSRRVPESTGLVLHPALGAVVFAIIVVTHQTHGGPSSRRQGTAASWHLRHAYPGRDPLYTWYTS